MYTKSQVFYSKLLYFHVLLLFNTFILLLLSPYISTIVYEYDSNDNNPSSYPNNNSYSHHNYLTPFHRRHYHTTYHHNDHNYYQTDYTISDPDDFAYDPLGNLAISDAISIYSSVCYTKIKGYITISKLSLFIIGHCKTWCFLLRPDWLQRPNLERDPQLPHIYSLVGDFTSSFQISNRPSLIIVPQCHITFAAYFPNCTLMVLSSTTFLLSLVPYTSLYWIVPSTPTSEKINL